MLHIIRFASLVIGLFFVLHALKSCSVHAYQGGETSDEESFIQKEFHGGLGGRKNGRHEVVASENTGANRSEGKCEFEEKGAFKVKCKSWNENSTEYPKVETADFVAFGADYRGPKRHPPEHN